MKSLRSLTKTVVRAAYAGIASVPPLPGVITCVNKMRHQGRDKRWLEIGPGAKRLPGFETLNIVPGIGVDYVHDAARDLPFEDGTFDLIYASHILEHVPWFQTLATLQEWVRVLKVGGAVEVWVPDGLKICETLLRFEQEGVNGIEQDNWYKFNPERDVCKWAAGRLFTYGDGSGCTNHPNWHRGVFTPRYLKELFVQAGLTEVAQMTRAQVRGADHGWINLGMRGVKPAEGTAGTLPATQAASVDNQGPGRIS